MNLEKLKKFHTKCARTIFIHLLFRIRKLTTEFAALTRSFSDSTQLVNKKYARIFYEVISIYQYRKNRKNNKITEIQDIEKEKPKNVTFRPLLPCSSEINLLSIVLLFSKNVLAY